MNLRFLVIVALFVVSTILLLLLLSFGPEMEEGSAKDIRFPHSFEQLRAVADYFAVYRDRHYVYVVLLFSLTYLYKQTFAIPGSFFMNILAGALFGRWQAMLLVCPLTVIGASLCYKISALFARPLVERYLGERLFQLKCAVSDNHDNLFYFLLCARLFPFTPHWLLNICSPFVNIPLSKFAASIFIGLAPYNFLCVQAGDIIKELNSPVQVFNFTNTLELIVVAGLMLLFGLHAKFKAARKGNIA